MKAKPYTLEARVMVIESETKGYETMQLVGPPRFKGGPPSFVFVIGLDGPAVGRFREGQTVSITIADATNPVQEQYSKPRRK